jgi:hypothetical protein
MSNQLAIANATCTLRYLLSPAVRIVPGAQVTTVRPDSLGTAKMTRGVNLYLYRITPNTAYRNVDIPTRRPDGSLSEKPTQVVDLHFLVSTFGDETKLESQLLMGAVVGRMHEVGILSGSMMEEAKGANGELLDGSDLPEQKPRPRIIMEAMTDEALSRIWGVLYQVPYQLTVAYRVGPIFIESDLDVEPREPVSDVNLDFQDMDNA